MIGNIPDGWRVEKLEDITEFLTCGVAKRPEYIDKDIGIPFLSSKNIKTNRMILNDYNCVSKEDYEILTKYYKPKKGDILYTRVGSLGEAVVVNVDFDFAVFVSLTIMRAKSEIVNNYYLSNILNSPLMKQIANEKARGIGVKNLNVGDVRKFLIPLPPLPQQEKIVKVLDISSGLIEKQKELIENYDLFLKSKFIEMFGDPVQNPMGWEVEKLSNLGKWQSGGTPLRSNTSFYNGNIDWYSSGELNSLYTVSSTEKITEEALNKSSAKLFKKNTLLVGMYDTAAFKMSILKNVASTNQAIANLDNDLDKTNVLWLYFVFLLNKEVYLNSRAGVRQQNLSLTKIKALKTILPPIDLQNKFASIVETIDAIKTKEIQKLEHLETLHSSLMDKAFNGGIE